MAPKICGTLATRGGPNLLRITSPARLFTPHFPPLSTVVSAVVSSLRLEPLTLSFFSYTSTVARSSLPLFRCFSLRCFFELQFCHCSFLYSSLMLFLYFPVFFSSLFFILLYLKFSSPSFLCTLLHLFFILFNSFLLPLLIFAVSIFCYLVLFIPRAFTTDRGFLLLSPTKICPLPLVSRARNARS